MRPVPTACVRHEKGVAIKSVTDGLSKTLLFGEKYNEDPNFDAIPDQLSPQCALIYEFSYWGWTGGLPGHRACHAEQWRLSASH